jgi:aminopeptidase N
VYKRGALTLHALRQQLGDERFFAMLRGWVAQHRYGTVTTDSFLKHWCADTATFDLVEAWLRRPALPDLARSR